MKNTVKFILFAAAACLMIFGLSCLFRSRACTISSLYEVENDSVQVFVVGGSHVNAGFIPNLLWENYQISSENVYSWNQPIWAAYYYLQEGLRTQSPDVVVLDVFAMCYGRSYIAPDAMVRDTYSSAFTIRPGLPLYGMAVANQRVDAEHELSDYINLFRYHTRWKELFSKDYFYNSYRDYGISTLHGYGISTAKIETESISDFTFVDWSEEPYSYCAEYLEKIVELSQKRGFELVLVSLPYNYEATEKEVLNWVEEYAENKGLPFLNYNGKDRDRIGFDPAEDLQDKGHLNYYGAAKVTLDIGAFLSEHYRFTEISESAKESRSADSARFNRIEKENFVMLSQERAPEFIREAVNDELYQLVLFIGDAETLGTGTAAFLQAAGIDVCDRTAVFIDYDGSIRAESAGDGYETVVGGYRFYVRDGSDLSNEREICAPGTNAAVLYDALISRPVEYALVHEDGLEHTEFTLRFWG